MLKHSRMPIDKTGKAVVVGIVLILTFAVVTGASIASALYSSTLIPLNLPKELTEWHINDESVKLPIDIELDPRDSTTLSSRLMEVYAPTSVLLFYTTQTMVDVRVDNELVYAYGCEKTTGILEIAPAWHTIRLPDDYSGKTIDITLTAGVLPVKSAIDSVYMGTYAHCLIFVFVKGLFTAISGGLIAVLALILLFLQLAMGGKYATAKDAVAYAFFILLVGIDIMVTSGMQQFVFHSADITQLISKLTHMLYPLPLLYSAAVLTQKNKFIGAAAKWTCIAGTAAMCVFFALMAYKVMPYEQFTHVRLIMWGVYAAFVIAAYVIKEKKSNMGASLGSATILVVCMACDVLLWRITGVSGTHKACYLGATASMVLWFIEIVQNYVRTASKTAALQAELENQRLSTIVKQIKPHFVYNTLNTIDAQILINPEAARDTIQSFSKYLRANIDSVTTTECIPLSKELDIVKNYLDIERTRFGERLNVVTDIAPDVDINLPVPPLSLQPIVENAVKHGVCKRAKGGTVTISATRKGDGHTITIADDGVGFNIQSAPRDAGDHKSMGIDNVKLRLNIMCNATCTIESTPNVGTTVTIFLPNRS